MPPTTSQLVARLVRARSSDTSQIAMKVTKIATGSRTKSRRIMPGMSPRITPDMTEAMTTSTISQAAMTTEPGGPVRPDALPLP